ncbi:gamma-glutamyl hydrolase B-like [Oratosquilla oratoria]|uniref:gamma-glutamyl hydrolase B-like n=1 Tax=Oratosquilla oratoria TaxID=337810 RepID=UPI003F75DBB1
MGSSSCRRWSTIICPSTAFSGTRRRTPSSGPRGRHKYDNIPHSSPAIEVGQYFGNFFVNQARLSSQKFFSTEEEKTHLIYNYEPTDVSGFTGFNQVYLFS